MNRGAKKAGVLVEVRVTPLDRLPFEAASFDVVVIHSAGGQLASADTSATPRGAARPAARAAPGRTARGDRARDADGPHVGVPRRAGRPGRLRGAAAARQRPFGRRGSAAVRELADREGLKFVEGRADDLARPLLVTAVGDRSRQRRQFRPKTGRVARQGFCLHPVYRVHLGRPTSTRSTRSRAPPTWTGRPWMRSSPGGGCGCCQARDFVSEVEAVPAARALRHSALLAAAPAESALFAQAGGRHATQTRPSAWSLAVHLMVLATVLVLGRAEAPAAATTAPGAQPSGVPDRSWSRRRGRRGWSARATPALADGWSARSPPVPQTPSVPEAAPPPLPRRSRNRFRPGRSWRRSRRSLRRPSQRDGADRGGG